MKLVFLDADMMGGDIDLTRSKRSENLPYTTGQKLQKSLNV